MKKNNSFPWVATPLAIAISGFAAGNALASATTDTSFGTNGIASLNFNNLGSRFLEGPGRFISSSLYDFIVARQPIVELNSGDIVSFASRYEEVGTATYSETWHTSCSISCNYHLDGQTAGYLTEGASKSRMSRFTAGGTPVSTVDIDGVMAVSALEQPDGKLLLMGNDLHRGPGSFLAGNHGVTTEKPVMTSQIVLQRFNADGSADSTFDGDGSLRIDLPGARQGNGLALMPDGKIMVLSVDFNTSSTNPELWRFNSDGSVDTSFGGDGNLPLPIPNAWNLLKQQDDKLLVHYKDSLSQAYARFNLDGSLDSGFAGDGTLNIAQYFSSAAPMLQQSDGKLLLSAKNVYRYDLNGTYEKTFTNPEYSTNPFSLAETAADKVLVARGASGLNGKVDIFNNSGSRKTTMLLDQYLYDSVNQKYGTTFGEILIQSNGTLLASGNVGGSATLNRHIIPSGVKNDYNNDGISGWYWKGDSSGNETKNEIWQLTFPLQSSGWGVPTRSYPSNFVDQPNWEIVTSGDFNKDGDADVLWRNKSTAQWRIWQIQNGTRSAQNDLADFDLAHEWQVIGAGDTDNDGDEDVILNNTSTGEVLVWKMQDHAITNTYSIGTKAGYTLNRIGDFNKDGDVDLLFRQNAGDALVTWEITNNTFVAERSLGNTGSGFSPACAGDFDNDGDDDIMLLNTATTQEKWIVMDNYGRTQRFGSANSGFDFVACGDYDGDGDTDTLWQRTSDAITRVVLQQNVLTTAAKQTVYSNPYGAVYGFVYRGNRN